MITTIFLIRHGETDWNREKRYQGQKDVPLNKIGKDQATNLAKRFIDEKIKVDAIYSSRLFRAKDTAEAIAANYALSVQVHEGLLERHFGQLEGVQIDEFRAKYPGVTMGNMEQMGSFNIEPFQLLKDRVFLSIEEISKRHINQNVVIVSHGAAINSFLHHITNGEAGSGITRIQNTSITTISHDHKENKWMIEELNNVSHIDN